MKKIIALALITSFAVTGTALARTAGGANGQGGGNDGQGASDNHVVQRTLVRAVRPQPPTYMPRRVNEFCHIAGETAASDYECGHNSR